MADNAGNTISNVLTLTKSALKIIRKPVERISAALVYATASVRPGISREIVTANIIEENGTYGINTGQMPDGTDNVVNKFVYNVVDKVVDELKDNSLVACVIPPASVMVEATGGNAGGPVKAVGTNVSFAKGYGIIR